MCIIERHDVVLETSVPAAGKGRAIHEDAGAIIYQQIILCRHRVSILEAQRIATGAALAADIISA
jgi:hypothetical protein